MEKGRIQPATSYRSEINPFTITIHHYLLCMSHVMSGVWMSDPTKGIGPSSTLSELLLPQSNKNIKLYYFSFQ